MPVNKPQEQRAEQTQNHAGYPWEINRCVPAAKHEVAGQPAERQIQFTERKRERAQDNQHQSGCNQQSPQIHTSKRIALH